MYRLTGRLEQGDLAELLRAERVGTGQQVVVKLFHERTTDAAYARVISQVARALQPLAGQQRIAQVLELGLVGSRLAIVRQDTGILSLGTALQRLNTREVVLPSSLALLLVLELLDVLAAAHAAGVVHGALTPGNVLLDDAGLPSIAEFGALEALQASPALRATFGSRGRTSYRAPELKTSTSKATEAADLYAVAAIAYELLTLREASTGGSQVSTRQAKVPPPSRLVRRLNSRIDPLIMRALEASPARRQKSVQEFADGLREFLASQGGLPRREDLKKFVGELFPNEVVAAPLAPPPFTTPFELTPLGDDAPLARASEQVLPRAPFSGGEVDAATPTSDGLPVFDDLPEAVEAKTQTEHPVLAREAAQPITDWDAPAAAPQAPVGPEPEVSANPEQLKGRLREREAFDVSDRIVGATPELRPEPPKRTVQTFVVDFPREGDLPWIDWEERRRKGLRQVQLAFRAGIVILLLTIAGMIFLWYRTTPDPWAAFWSYFPAPIERQFAPRHPALVPSIPGPRVVLPDFDQRHPSPAPVATPAPAPTPVVPKPEPARADCYPQPHGKAALVTVSGQNLRLEIDGVPVCGSLAKVWVTPGQHQLKVVDLSTHKEAASSASLEAGHTLKLSAPGRSR